MLRVAGVESVGWLLRWGMVEEMSADETAEAGWS